MSEKPAYQRIGRNDAIYDDGVIKLNLTIEAYKAKDGKWGEAVYVLRPLRELKPPLSPENIEQVVKNIQATLEAEGRHCSIE